MNFKNKVVVVTGGSQGIGKAICKGFAGAGAKVSILDIKETETQEVVDEIRESNGNAKFYKTNVMDSSSVKDSFDKILNEFGAVDILVNNAGIINIKPYEDVTENEYDLIMGVNLKSVFNTTKIVFPLMKERKSGKIINIASVAGKRGGGILGNTVYAASKAGVIGLTKGLAREGGPYGINVNAVCPGPTNTPMLKEFKGEKRDNFLNTIPLRKFGKPEGVANMVMFLASDLAEFITGEISDVDGGIMLD
ncbi:SDR family NAD(P)-dependent oxidoreductase [Clostridium sp. JNZ X4-2]